MSELTGKRVVVTGGGTGIGRGIALAFAKEGSRVAVSGRREEPLAETASLHQGDPAIVYKTCDVANSDDVSAFFAWAREELGGIDILVQSAGTNVPRRSVSDTTPDDWDLIVGVNANGAFYCMREVISEMRERGDGLIVNINSTSGKRAAALGGVAYCASKFAMSALGLFAGDAERNNGVRVTNLYPGEVETPILDRRPVEVPKEHRAKILQPEDIAAMVVAVAKLPPRANVPEIIVKPTIQSYI